MSKDFSVKLQWLLKVHTTSRTRLAADIGLDKSVVGRWVAGAVLPSDNNLVRLTSWAAERIPGFRLLDWDLNLDAFAARLGVDRGAVAPASAPPMIAGPPLTLMPQILATTAMRGGAYEGFYRSTRPFGAYPGQFVHDNGMIRLEENGLLSLTMVTAGVRVEAWMMPLHDKVFCIGSELTSGTLVFGVFNGVNTDRADVVDGLTLTPIMDAGRTPTAAPIIFERVADLSGVRTADDERFEILAATDSYGDETSVPAAIRDHLLRDFGPSEMARGGDLLLRLPLSRSRSRGAPPRRIA